MWNKLSVKRPPKNGDYLCVCKDVGGKYMCVMEYIADGTLIEEAITPYRLRGDIWKVKRGTTTHMNKVITHWMELPDMPDNA